jgi:putative FmdB family regulatory protein
MPIFEYECRKCEKRFEHLARSHAEKTPKCPSCGAANPVKQFSVFSATARAADLPSCAASKCSRDSCASGKCPMSSLG